MDDTKHGEQAALVLPVSLRDYFAAKALTSVTDFNMLQECMSDNECTLQIVNAASLSYRLADAMLEARQR